MDPRPFKDVTAHQAHEHRHHDELHHRRSGGSGVRPLLVSFRGTTMDTALNRWYRHRAILSTLDDPASGVVIDVKRKVLPPGEGKGGGKSSDTAAAAAPAHPLVPG